MKKFLTILLAVVLAFSVFALIACKDKPDEDENPTGAIRLRSEAELDLQVGDVYKLVFDAKYGDKNAKNDVNFASSDTSVVTVDAFGNITAVGAGEATVTLSLKADATVTASVKCSVIKTFFMTKPTYYKGNVDPTTADSEGWVRIIEGEQTQLLVSELSENWYFKTKLEHTGRTGADSSGRWGVGSFLVDDTHPIGEVMAWCGFQPTDHGNKTYTPYVGGWRVLSGGNDQEIPFASPMTNASTSVFEIIRYGTELYCTVTSGEQVAKYVYSTPSLAGKPTYPGVYSQRQELYISEFEATSDLQEVMQKLDDFQVAEKVTIEGLSNVLYNGETYALHATVSPATTFNKGVTFSLKEAVSGVSVTSAGELTIADNVTGDVTIVAKADSSDVTVERTYTIATKVASEHELFDKANIVGNTDNYTLGENSVTFAGGVNYVALKANAAKWAVSFTTSASKVGVMSADNGFCNYVAAYLDSTVKFVALGAKDVNTSFVNTASKQVTVIRDGQYYFVVVNGVLVDRYKAAITGNTMPVICGDNASGVVSDITLVTDADAINALIADYPHTVGRYVTKNADGSYTLAAMDFGNAKTDINWPPVNNYENGIKFADTLTGNYTIEFTMSNIKPLIKAGKADGKVLIYLRSETATSSIQFVFKGDANSIEAKFCPNLNDATWTEYPIDGVNLLGDEPVTVKVVKTATKVEVYLNGEIAFANNTGLNNNGYWDASTLCTPGIGTFMCGVTVSNVSLTNNND